MKDVDKPVTLGYKNDEGKLPWHLLPVDSLEEIIKVLAYGAKKYSPRNWEKGMEWDRPYDACMRHMWTWWADESCDTETKITHLAHAASNIIFLIAYEKRGIGTDTRNYDKPTNIIT